VVILEFIKKLFIVEIALINNMISIVEYLSDLAIHLIQALGYWGVFIGMTLKVHVFLFLVK
jgi:hypothetical protein